MPIIVLLTRRELLARAASVVVSQALFGCADSAVAAGSDTPGACVLTAALTEGPYFVDEMLNRSDIRADPASGVVSSGTPLQLTFNVARVVSGTYTPLTGAYVDMG